MSYPDKPRIERPDGNSAVISAAEQVVRTANAVDSVIHHDGKPGTGIVIPKTRSLRSAAKHIAEYAEAEESKTDMHHTVRNKSFYPACYALREVLSKTYGVDFAKPKPGFFGATNPVDVTFPIAPGTTTTVTIGQFDLLGMTVHSHFDDGFLTLVVECKNIDKPKALELFQLVDQADDIWRGQTIVFSDDPNRGPRTPEIIEPKLTLDDIALNPPEQAALSMFLNQIEYHGVLKHSHDIPFKRGVLLYGPWGTGKTLAAAVCMNAARRSGITVLQERNWSKLLDTVKLAQLMQPCLVFCEDIDLASNRTLTNILDDASLKDCAVSLMVTTNHPEKLDPALTRTGRLDISIGFELPNADARRRILEVNNVFRYNDDIANATDGMTGSDMAEIAKRATINCVASGDTMTDDHVLGAAVSMQKPPKYIEPENLRTQLQAVFNAGLACHPNWDNVGSQLRDIERTVDNIQDHTCGQ